LRVALAAWMLVAPVAEALRLLFTLKETDADESPYIVPLGAPVIVTICERPGAVGNGADVAGGEEDPTTLLATTWTVYVLP
jgi:hypothetical protein